MHACMHIDERGRGRGRERARARERESERARESVGMRAYVYVWMQVYMNIHTYTNIIHAFVQDKWSDAKQKCIFRFQALYGQGLQTDAIHGSVRVPGCMNAYIYIYISIYLSIYLLTFCSVA